MILQTSHVTSDCPQVFLKSLFFGLLPSLMHVGLGQVPFSATFMAPEDFRAD